MKALFNRGSSPITRLVIAVILSITLLITDTHYHYIDPLRATLSVLAYPLYYVADWPTRAFHIVTDYFGDKHRLYTENLQLHAENLILKARVQKYSALEAENRRLRSLLGSAFKIGERVLIAELLAVDLDPYRQQVLVNKGMTSGVFVGQPVLDAHAVMGQIIRTNPLTSIVLLITDATHSLPVQVNRNGLRTIAEGTGMIDQLNLLYVSKTADIQIGDLLVTSGLGGVFPPGYPVAKVNAIRLEPGKQFATVLAEPTARLDRSHEVLLVWSLAPQKAENTL
jgi:rod shape-determining protein MreC